MELLEKSEFTNRNRDRVNITLFQDSSGGFHVIVGSTRSRKLEEMRVIAGKPTIIHSNSTSQETKIIQLPTKGSALNEFNLYRVLENEPGYGMPEYMAWQKTRKEES